MRLLATAMLLACSAGSSAPEDTATAPAAEPSGGEAAEHAPSPAVAAAESLIRARAQPAAPIAPAQLGDALAALADELGEDEEPAIRSLRGVAQGLQAEGVSERDRHELVDLAIELLWQLTHERAQRGTPDPVLCPVAIVMARRGPPVWRAALRERLDREGVAVTASDYRDWAHEEFRSRQGCEHLDEVSGEGEACSYRQTLVFAHWLAFADDGPLAKIAAGLDAGPAEAARAIEAHLEATEPIFQLLGSPSPRRAQVADVPIVCAGG